MYPKCYPSQARQDPSPRRPQRAHRFRPTKRRRIGAGQAQGMNFLRSKSSSQIISFCVAIWCLLRSFSQRRIFQRSKSSSQIISCCVAIWCLLRSSPQRSWPRPTPPFEGSTNRSCILGLRLPIPLVHSHPLLASSKTLGSNNINKHAVFAFRSVFQSPHETLGCNLVRRALPSSAPHSNLGVSRKYVLLPALQSPAFRVLCRILQ